MDEEQVPDKPQDKAVGVEDFLDAMGRGNVNAVMGLLTIVIRKYGDQPTPGGLKSVTIDNEDLKLTHGFGMVWGPAAGQKGTYRLKPVKVGKQGEVEA